MKIDEAIKFAIVALFEESVQMPARGQMSLAASCQCQPVDPAPVRNAPDGFLDGGFVTAAAQVTYYLVNLEHQFEVNTIG
jgi:hypothetical protein